MMLSNSTLLPNSTGNKRNLRVKHTNARHYTTNRTKTASDSVRFTKKPEASPDKNTVIYHHPLGDVIIPTTQCRKHDEFGEIIYITMPRIEFLQKP